MINKFNWQSFISIGLLISFLVMLISGVVLYIAPEGSLSRWIGWDVFSLTKTGNLDPTPIPGMPSTYRGSLPVSLTSNGDSVYVINSVDNTPVACTSCRLLLFEPSTNTNTRSELRCSLYQ